MAKRKRKKARSKFFSLFSLLDRFSLPDSAKRYVFGVLSFLFSVIFILSFFEKAGVAGKALNAFFIFLIGRTIYLLPLVLLFATFLLFKGQYEHILRPLLLGAILTLAGISGFLENLEPQTLQGGWIGKIVSWPLLKFFDVWVANIIFFGLAAAGLLIFWSLSKGTKEHEGSEEKEEKPSLIKKIFTPSFKINNIESSGRKIEKQIKQDEKIETKTEVPAKLPSRETAYQLPPIDLLDSPRGRPSAGDIKINSAIIKKTLESFDIPVEMAEVSVGPTVTQYSLKPAEGIKLSKITSLSNDLALALAAHPIRIEAPIPGKSLVGIEIPNKVRVPVRFKEVVERPEFQNSLSNLTITLGRDVSGSVIYADLSRMPHLLVAGSTGSGKTIFLNTLINSLLYKNSPEELKFILIDPKRVEFTIYSKLPHFLCPAIVDTQKAVNALRWLIDEMDRRFRMLSRVKSRDIRSYNESAQKNGKERLPYIILVIDELADLMAAKGRDVETAIVRLAQMSRAVGIHLVVATQRPSVEVITGLIKANITSRITFQVASQVDSRTVLDVSGAEKLLGRGDMLYLSTENLRPKRIQSAYISEKEVKKVANWIRENVDNDLDLQEPSEMEDSLQEKLEEGSEQPSDLSAAGFGEDPLYEEAKRVVIQTRRASASLLQRKLRIGYARAARLIDILEENKVVGPSQGAKSREVFATEQDYDLGNNGDESEDDKWEQV